MEKKRISELLDKYSSDTCTKQEKAVVEAWYNSYAAEHISDSIDENMDQEMRVIWEKTLISTSQVKKHQSRYKLQTFIAAASIAIIATILVFYQQSSKKSEAGKAITVNNIKPGKNTATLTLANGRKIILSDVKNGELAEEAGVMITKTADGSLIYKIQEGANGANKINTISTAKGETYQIILPDGSKVWLNSASSLTYSANLNASGKRKVKLVGEAYFEIAKDKAHPFLVETNKQEVEVLGTHFNINAYSDEAYTRTTLLEGSVRLNHSTLLKPGEQAALNTAGKVVVDQVDVNEAIAWKNGKFIFVSEDIKSVMRKLSRWYDVEVVFKTELNDVTFTGSISRNDNISKILDKINYTEAAHIVIEGRRVVVMP